jgi:hypothetical protein
VATVEFDAHSERGLSGADWKRKPWCATLEASAQKREHATQAYSCRGILFRIGWCGPLTRRRGDTYYGGVLVGPDELRQVFNDTNEETLWLIIGAPEELEFLQGYKSEIDLSQIYPVNPTQLPRELDSVEWPPKS